MNMRIAVFSTKPYDRRYLDAANEAVGSPHDMTYLEPRLASDTARFAEGCDAACVFVNDDASRPVLEALQEAGVRWVATRSAGYNHIDLDAAKELGLGVARVPAYAPEGVAEHAIALMLALNRKIHRAYNRVREHNFSLEGLMGFQMHGRTVGVVGTGKTGSAAARVLHGFGCNLLGYDIHENDDLKELGMRYVDLPELLRDSDIVTLHAPLTPDTHHLINAETLPHCRDGVMLINTGRGGLVDTSALIDALKSGRLGSLGLDVYEEEDEFFFEDLSTSILQDDTFARLLTFPNVIITGHQAFFTEQAMDQIATETIDNFNRFGQGDDDTPKALTPFQTRKPAPNA